MEKHEAKRVYPVLLMLEVEAEDRDDRVRVTRRLELSRDGVEKIRRHVGGDLQTELPDLAPESLAPVTADELLAFDPDEEEEASID